MSLRYHRLFNVGPLHVAASKSGISYGAGVKGTRITERADRGAQTTDSAPGYLPRLHNHKGPKGKAPASTSPAQASRTLRAAATRKGARDERPQPRRTPLRRPRTTAGHGCPGADQRCDTAV
jgi:hypothetical protein